jgi:hypothetical protein
VIVRGVIAPTVAAQERHHLLSTSIATEAASYSFGTLFLRWPPPVTFSPIWLYRNLRTGPLKPAILELKRAAEKLYGVPRRIGTWNASRAARKRAELRNADGRMYSLYFVPNRRPIRIPG